MAELRIEPSLEQARTLAAEGNVVPIRTSFVDDCETPVSAFLKLRAGEPGGAPCFLLESAEQGQVGRYSFVGIRPRSLLRWSDGILSETGEAERQAADPYAAVAESLARFQLAPVARLKRRLSERDGGGGAPGSRSLRSGRREPRPLPARPRGGPAALCRRRG